MAGHNVILSPEAQEDLKNLDPSDQQTVRGVLDLLAETTWRNNHKYDLYYQDEFTELPVWAVADQHVFVAFIEYEDGRVGVAHISLISRFRPPARPWW